MRFRNLLTFEKGDQIMGEYFKIVYSFNNALGNFVIMHIKIEFKEKYGFYKYKQYVFKYYF